MRSRPGGLCGSPLWVFPALFLVACGAEVGRIAFATMEPQKISIDLEDGETQFWVELDVRYKSSLTLVYEITLQQDGETIAIGGLVKETVITTLNKVPVLGDIPIIGLLFQNKFRGGGGTSPTLQQDLLIFLTVSLEKDDKKTQAVASAASPE